MSSYIYNRGRQSGSHETEAALRQQHEELDRKFLADLERERDQQKRAVDKMKIDHRAEVTSRSLAETQHVEGARLATRKYQVALENEREQSARKLRALASIHEQERGQMKEEHDYKVNHLYEKIGRLVAEKTEGQETMRQEYAAELEQKQAYIEYLEQKLHAAGESVHGRQFGAVHEKGMPAPKEAAPPTMDSHKSLIHGHRLGDGRQHHVDQTTQLQHVWKKNAEQAKMILGLQATVAHLGRQLTDMGAGGRQAPPMPYMRVPAHPDPRHSPGTFTPPAIIYPQHLAPQPPQHPAQPLHALANGRLPHQTFPHAPYTPQPLLSQAPFANNLPSTAWAQPQPPLQNWNMDGTSVKYDGMNARGDVPMPRSVGWPVGQKKEVSESSKEGRGK